MSLVPRSSSKPTRARLHERFKSTVRPRPCKGILEPLEGTGTTGWVLIVEAELEEYALEVFTADFKRSEPRTVAEVRKRPDSPLWGVGNLEGAREWTRLSFGRNGFSREKDAAGNVVKYKARLIAQGYSQPASTTSIFLPPSSIVRFT